MNKANINELGKLIRKKRKLIGFSQDDLANMLNVDQTAISQWERGTTLPDLNNYFEICRILDLNDEKESISMDEVNVVLSIRRAKDLFNSLNSELIEEKADLKRMQEYNETTKSKYPFVTDVLEDHVNELERDLENLKKALEQ